MDANKDVHRVSTKLFFNVQKKKKNNVPIRIVELFTFAWKPIAISKDYNNQIRS